MADEKQNEFEQIAREAANSVPRIDALERMGMEFEAAMPDIVSEEFVKVEHRGQE